MKTKVSLFTILLLLGGAGFMLRSLPAVVIIESQESKTTEGSSVFNRISYEANSDVDVWDMKQSHDGLKHPLHQWDHIQIKVHKKTKPYFVTYHQLEENREVEFKAACFTCHPNGPRVIRPDWESKKVSYTLKDKMKIALMNLRIKAYGKIELDESSAFLNGELRKIPLKFFGKHDVQKLNIQTCTFCHNSSGGFFHRGELEGQHKGTIAHLTKHHQMPPWPFKLSEDEKRELAKFLGK